jgi:hypothetical protein
MQQGRATMTIIFADTVHHLPLTCGSEPYGKLLKTFQNFVTFQHPKNQKQDHAARTENDLPCFGWWATFARWNRAHQYAQYCGWQLLRRELRAAISSE